MEVIKGSLQKNKKLYLVKYIYIALIFALNCLFSFWRINILTRDIQDINFFSTIWIYCIQILVLSSVLYIIKDYFNIKTCFIVVFFLLILSELIVLGISDLFSFIGNLSINFIVLWILIQLVVVTLAFMLHSLLNIERIVKSF